MYTCTFRTTTQNQLLNINPLYTYGVISQQTMLIQGKPTIEH